MNSRIFVPEELWSESLDNAEEMLDTFISQYKEDNLWKNCFYYLFAITLAFGEGYKDFAKEMQYETKYEVAFAKAKEQKKSFCLMVTNYHRGAPNLRKNA